MPNCPKLERGGYDYSIVPTGVCFYSRVDILASGQILNKSFNKKRSQSFLSKIFSKGEDIKLSLKEVENEVKSGVEAFDAGCFSYLLYSPQYWMNGFDLAYDVEIPEISWGWTGTNKPNIFCPNCDAPVGTEIDYLDIPTVFIPEPKATKWQNVKS